MTADQIGIWLERHVPPLFPVARALWHFGWRLTGRDYWQLRREFNYYREVVRLAKHYVPLGGRAIDVGASDARLLSRLDWFSHRIALDVRRIPRQRGVETIVRDFMTYESAHDIDLVFCLQVLEHLADPSSFAQKVLRTGRTAIISVPWQWPRGLGEGHVQDPIDGGKLEQWTQRVPVETVIVEDKGRKRLIAVYQWPGSSPSL